MKRVVSVLGGFVVVSVMAVGPANAQSAAPAAGPTFTKDVAPILQEKCQACHRPESMAPMSLLTYEEVRPWARSIKERVVKREMPPWLVDPNIGPQKFKNDPSLTDAQIATIASWIDGGAPRGNPADMPPPKKFLDAYTWEPRLGPPDLVVELPQENLIKANDSNWWGDFFTSEVITEDRYVRAVQSLPGPGAAQVVHHMHAFLVQDSDGDGTDEENHLNEYAMGKGAEMYPEGTAKVIKAGARVKFNLHYAATSTDVKDRARVGMWFYPKGYTPKHTIIVTPTAQNNETLDIPPNAAMVRNDGYELMDSAIRITGFQPHMHNRGKRQCLEAIYPNGKTEMLICTNWDFGWHIQYLFDDDVQPILPKGSMVHQISWYDNTTKNKWNPDPTNWAGCGRRSSDEMSFVWLGYYKITDEEYRETLKERLAKKAATTTNDPRQQQ